MVQEEEGDGVPGDVSGGHDGVAGDVSGGHDEGQTTGYSPLERYYLNLYN